MYDITIIGGGILGLATGYNLLKKNPSLKLNILEKEPRVGQHQTGNNSGVIHSGIYYKPGSLKAINCRKGIKKLIDFCIEFNIPYDICGKLIIATNNDEIKTLDMLENRGIDNGIKGLKKLSSNQILDFEPHVSGLAGLYCPETGIVDYLQVCEKLSDFIKKKAEIKLENKVIDIINDNESILVSTSEEEYRTQFIINCAGLFSDKVAELSGFKRDLRIIPFRGEYYMLKKESRYLVNNLIYPVPDPRYPFLGVHFTRTINGNIEAGPNAVLAWSREGYTKTSINFNHVWDYLSYKGFWRMAGKYWSTAVGEYYRSFSKKAFVSALQKLIPEISEDDIYESPSGVRAQALSQNGSLIDDFVIRKSNKMLHVINAPSPAATSSFSIGDHLSNLYEENI